MWNARRMTCRGNSRNASETVAARFLVDSNLAGKPCSALALASAAGLWTCGVRGKKARGLVGRRIYFDVSASPEWQEAFLTRCVARWALRWYREKVTEASLRDCSRALLHRSQQRHSARVAAERRLSLA
jgi:hypothetical protein